MYVNQGIQQLGVLCVCSTDHAREYKFVIYQKHDTLCLCQLCISNSDVPLSDNFVLDVAVQTPPAVVFVGNYISSYRVHLVARDWKNCPTYCCNGGV